ncbi:transcriptional regulator, partial [Salmonella enterica subsp. enterica serovar Anatum]|nr:transcriptional regulator [Salmonella enterica subsp. enterica serovar Anatum]
MTEKEMLQRMLMDMSLLKKLITDHIKNEQRPDTTKEILTVEECAELTGLKKST